MTSSESTPHSSQSIETIARGVLIHAGHVLLCQALDSQGEPKYAYLPGGHVEFGESAADALAREFIEEAGLEVQVGACMLVGENRFTQPSKHKKRTSKRRHEYTLVFHVEHVGEQPSAIASSPTVSHASSLSALPARSTPPPIASLESDISFIWVRLTDLSSITAQTSGSTKLDIRPNSHGQWLCTHAAALDQGERLALVFHVEHS